MEVKKVNINDLKPANYNPRQDLQPGDPEYEKLKRSIQEFGYVDLIILNKQTKNIIGGHQRWKVLKDLGFKEISAVEVDLPEAKEKMLNVALNKINGEWDMDKLKDLLQDLDDGSNDLELTGFDMDEIEDMMTQYYGEDDSDVQEDDFDADDNMPEIPMTKRGDIYRLGRHYLMCGDSTNGQDVAKLLQGQKANLLITDPPYNVDYEGKDKSLAEYRPNKRVEENKIVNIENDKMDSNEFRQFLTSVFTNANDNMIQGAVFYIWHADWYGYQVRGAVNDAGWKIRQNLIWVKNMFVLGRQDYQWQHEPCLYGWTDGAAHYWNGGRSQTSVFDDAASVDVNKLKKNELIDLVKDLIKYKETTQTTVLREDKPSASSLHPTMKPIKLFARQILNSSQKDDIVLDLFGGSGTTLIACEQLERSAYLMELDEKYCDVIIQRWEEFTGETAEKINR